MKEQINTTAEAVKSTQIIAQENSTIMDKVRYICDRGNNAEIKRRRDGTLAVMEVKKNIV